MQTIAAGSLYAHMIERLWLCIDMVSVCGFVRFEIDFRPSGIGLKKNFKRRFTLQFYNYGNYKRTIGIHYKFYHNPLKNFKITIFRRDTNITFSW